MAERRLRLRREAGELGARARVGAPRRGAQGQCSQQPWGAVRGDWRAVVGERGTVREEWGAAS